MRGFKITKASKKNNDIPKGELGGECNRSACDKSNAVFFNHSTEKYYCPKCARTINEYNKKDAMELYGHNLCTYSVRINL